MPIYDNNGTTSYEIGTLYDNNGTTSYQIGKVYDNNGTTSSLIYSSEEVLFINNTSSGSIRAWQLYAWASSTKWNNVKVTTGSTGSTNSTNGNVYVKPEMVSDKMQILTNHSTVGGNWTCIQSDEKITVSGTATLRFTYYRSGTRTGALPKVGVVSARPANTANGSQIAYLTWEASASLTNSTSATTIDVTVPAGSYYICFDWTANAYDSGPSNETFYITKIELL